MTYEVTMKVECVHCGASGQMDETKIPVGVTTLKCPKCSQSFPIPFNNVETVTPAPTQTVQTPPPIEKPLPIETIAPLRAATALRANCSVCSDQHPQDEMVRFGLKWVCAACKPSYVQMLAQGTPRPGELRYAGFNIRFGAKILDGLILWMLSFLISLLIGLVMPKSAPKVAIAAAAISFVIQITIAAAYSGYFLSQHQATPGKMACGLVVVCPEGDRISVMRGVGRYFAEVLSSITLGIGYLMILFDAEKRALHDRICNTRVVYK